MVRTLNYIFKALYIVKIVLIISLSFAFADDYFVDQNHPSASDSNPGTSGLPFLTVSKAAQIAVAGDIVTIVAGTYCEEVVVQNSGASINPIVFQAAEYGTVNVHDKVVLIK